MFDICILLSLADLEMLANIYFRFAGSSLIDMNAILAHGISILAIHQTLRLIYEYNSTACGPW